jgi:hypothetical protein
MRWETSQARLASSKSFLGVRDKHKALKKPTSHAAEPTAELGRETSKTGKYASDNININAINKVVFNFADLVLLNPKTEGDPRFEVLAPES